MASATKFNDWYASQAGYAYLGPWATLHSRVFGLLDQCSQYKRMHQYQTATTHAQYFLHVHVHD